MPATNPAQKLALTDHRPSDALWQSDNRAPTVIVLSSWAWAGDAAKQSRENTAAIRTLRILSSFKQTYVKRNIGIRKAPHKAGLSVAQRLDLR